MSDAHFSGHRLHTFPQIPKGACEPKNIKDPRSGIDYIDFRNAPRTLFLINKLLIRDFFSGLRRYILHTIKCTHLKYIVQPFLFSIMTRL